MSSYGQFCPVAMGAEIFAERWTPLILRELLLGSRRFNDLHRGLPRISRNLLTQRLHSLQKTGIIEQLDAANGHGHEYRLTQAGRQLGAVIESLGTWAYQWACKDLTDEHLDPDFLMWALRRMIRCPMSVWSACFASVDTGIDIIGSCYSVRKPISACLIQAMK
jgi:DNA-binding HxlR family transcriptional regulator